MGIGSRSAMGSKTKKYKFKSDRFKKSRGGHSRWLSLSCGKCKSKLLVYQKDGPGILKRLYLDRIVFPKHVNEKKTLICQKCQTVLGILSIYEKENRKAYRLFVGAIEKKIVKGHELPTI